MRRRDYEGGAGGEDGPAEQPCDTGEQHRHTQNRNRRQRHARDYSDSTVTDFLVAHANGVVQISPRKPDAPRIKNIARGEDGRVGGHPRRAAESQAAEAGLGVRLPCGLRASLCQRRSGCVGRPAAGSFCQC